MERGKEMELKTQLKTAELLMKLLKGEEKEIHVLKGREEKRLQSKKEKNVLFERANPENVGVSSKELLYFLKDMAENIEASLHEIMILVNGKVILETAFSPYRKEDWHISHSLCKSVTNLAIGLLFTDGQIKLDEKVTSIFSGKKIAFRGKMKRVTVEHLLTMSSGIAFNEASSLFEEDWVKGCLSSGVLFEPGTKFFYNSLNSYLLSAIVVEKTGKGLVDYLEEKLFQKMEIVNVFWEKCPKGIEKGGWGLSLTTEDVAKIGALYLQKGLWNGEQLIAKSYMERSVQKQIETPKSISEYGYGYQVWMTSVKGGYQFNGMFGQNVFLFPDTKSIVITMAGSPNFFPKSYLFDIVMHYFGEKRVFLSEEQKEETFFEPRSQYYQQCLKQYKEKCFYRYKPIFLEQFYEEPNWEERKEVQSNKSEENGKEIREYGWKETIDRIFHKRKKEKQKERISETVENISMKIQERKEEQIKKSIENMGKIEDILGKKYKTAQAIGGILPLFLQVMHGTYSKGITQFELQRRNGEEKEIILIVEEDQKRQEICIGFSKPCYGIYEIEEEQYEIGVFGTWCNNEDELLVLKVTICFIETSHTRVLYFYFSDEIQQGDFFSDKEKKREEVQKCFYDKVQKRGVLRCREEPELEKLLEQITLFQVGEQKDKALMIANTIRDLDYTNYCLKKIMEPKTEFFMIHKKEDDEKTAAKNI